MQVVPQVQSGVGAPGPPGFGDGEQLFRLGELQRLHQTQIALRKRIGIAQRAHRDVARRPISDTGQLPELSHARLHIRGRFQAQLTAREGARQTLKGLRALGGQAEVNQPLQRRVGYALRAG